MFMNQDKTDCAVLNFEDPLVKKMEKSVSAQVIWFGDNINKKHGAAISGKDLVYRNARKGFRISTAEWKLIGRHNIENLLAATAAAGWFGASPEAIQDAVNNFRPPEHRIEFTAEVQGVKYYDDSKATTPHAVAAALNSFNEPVIILLGGRNKGIDFRPLSKDLKSRAKFVLCFGEARYEIAEQLATVGIKARVAEKMADAVMLARNIASLGEIVLLSPGCASFDEFKDYKDRGAKFKEMVRNLK
jgi:UDP-N-acetylmuramoylalanine--D-glutamate ligase